MDKKEQSLKKIKTKQSIGTDILEQIRTKQFKNKRISESKLSRDLNIIG